MFCSLIFQGVLRTPPVSKPSKILFTAKTRTWPKICRICRNPKLHLVAFVHTSSRIFHSLNLVYMPFYINETSVREAGIIAMAPFFSFIGSLVASLVITYTSKMYSNNKVPNSVMHYHLSITARIDCINFGNIFEKGPNENLVLSLFRMFSMVLGDQCERQMQYSSD